MLHNFKMATFRLGWLARLLLIESGRQLEELENAYATVLKSLHETTPAQVRRLGRNDPCWCGSGEKLKRCHGNMVRSG
jgi:uncharacterized protein YecA (UPF0149 family)